MTHLLIQEIEKIQINQKIPPLKSGYTIKVFQKIREGGKERIQAFEGLIIAVNHGRGAGKTITVRRVVQGIGVEKIFVLSSPNIQKIEILKVGKVRRAKLYYMRKISGKATRLKEKIGEKKKLMEAMGIKIENEKQEKINADLKANHTHDEKNLTIESEESVLKQNPVEEQVEKIENKKEDKN